MRNNKIKKVYLSNLNIEGTIDEKHLSNLSSIRSEGSDDNKNNESRDDYIQFLGHLTHRNRSLVNIESSSRFAKKKKVKKVINLRASNSRLVKDTKLGKNKSNFLPTLTSKVIKKMKESKIRKRKYLFKLSNKEEVDPSIKAYNLPETKYDIDTIRDARIQFTIIYNEIN